MEDKEFVAILDDRLGALREQLDARLEQVDARFDQVAARFDQVDARFDQVDARFDQVDARFDQVDARFDRVEEQVRGAYVQIEQLRGTIQVVAEGVTAVDQKLDQFREETAQNFADVRSEMHFIDQRVTALERRK